MQKFYKLLFVSALVLGVAFISLQSISAIAKPNPVVVIRPDQSNYTLIVKKGALAAGNVYNWTAEVKGNLPDNACYSASIAIVGGNKAVSINDDDIEELSTRPGSVIVRLILNRTNSCAQKGANISLKQNFTAQVNANISFRVLKFDETAKDVTLKNGAVFTNATNGLTIRSVYTRKDAKYATVGEWDYRVTGKISHCYDARVQPVMHRGTHIMAEDRDVTIRRDYFTGQYIITLVRNTESGDCTVKDKTINIYGKVTNAVQLTTKYQSRIRIMESGVLKNDLKLAIRELN